ncbi:MAG: PIG-L deacetylase family protein [Bacteroidales bacterium]
MLKKIIISSISLFMLGILICSANQDATKNNTNNQDQLRIMIIGAHPDDAESLAGLAALYVQDGHKVQLVSVTNGDKGHQSIGEIKLANIRRQEAANAGKVIDSEYIVMNNHDGELVPNLETRIEVIRLIREFNPDIIFTHPPDDYHPDHRNTCILVRDATYMVMVPRVAPETPPMKHNPILFYEYEGNTDPDFVIGIDETMDKKIEMWHQHKSQMYDWLPWIGDYTDEVPEGEEARKQWLREKRSEKFKNIANNYRDILVEIYGEEKGKEIKYAEAFRFSEAGIGGRFEMDQIYRYFPFLEKYK